MRDITMQVHPDGAVIDFDIEDSFGVPTRIKVAVAKDGTVERLDTRTEEITEHDTLADALRDAPAQEIAELTTSELADVMLRDMQLSWGDFEREAVGAAAGE